jgi:PII-like signaling protein
MQIPEDAVLLRIFIGESDRWQHQPLFEAIVRKAREMHMAGTTVLRGPIGFGKSSRLHTAKILRLSMACPSSSKSSTVKPPSMPSCRRWTK